MRDLEVRLQGRGVLLEPLQERHLPLTLRWRNRDEIRKWFGDSGVITEEGHGRWFEGYLGRPDDRVFVICEAGSRRPVGQVALYRVDGASSSAVFGRLMIGEPNASGKGLAKAASRAVLDYAFSALGIATVRLEVREDNERAIGLYKSLGFAESGREGRMVLMEVTRDGGGRMKIPGEKWLTCGHRLSFYTPRMGALPSDLLPHVKTESVQAAYNDLLARHYPGLKPKRLLEVGVERGGSLALWRECFGCPVTGIDRDLGQVEKAVHRHFDESPGAVTLVSMTMPDPRAAELGQFDFIVDDGGHGAGLVLATLDILWKQLLPGGLYVIEDWRLALQDPVSTMSALSRRIIEDESLEYASVDAPAKMTVYRSLIVLEKKASPPPHARRDATL